MGRCSSALVEDGGSGKSPVGSSFGTLYRSFGGEEDKRGPFLILPWVPSQHGTFIWMMWLKEKACTSFSCRW